jgi:hypothetical protein
MRAKKKNKKLKCAIKEAGRNKNVLVLISHISEGVTSNMSTVLNKALISTAMPNKFHVCRVVLLLIV